MPPDTPTQTPTEGEQRPRARGKVTVGLAVLACLACFALPLLIAAGLLTAGTAAVLQQTLLAVGAGLAVLGASLWWLFRRRTDEPPAPDHVAAPLTAPAPTEDRSDRAHDALNGG